MSRLWRNGWPVLVLVSACLAAMLAQYWFGAQEIGFRKQWAWALEWMPLYPSAFHDDGFDWGWQRATMLFSHGF